MDDFFRRMFGIPDDPWGRHGAPPLRRNDDWTYSEEPRDFYDNGWGSQGGGGAPGFGPFGGFPFSFGASPFGDFGNHVDDMFMMVEKQFEDMSRSFGHMVPQPALEGPADYNNRGSIRDRMLKSPESYHNPRQDQDLDDRFSSGDYDSVLSSGPSTENVPDNRIVLAPPRNHYQPPGGRMWGSSMSVTRIQGADGKVEERRTTQDFSGNQSTTVTRQLGDQSYSTTIKSNKTGGVQEEIEEFNNMGEADLDEFQKKWDRRNQGRIGPGDTRNNQPPSNELMLRNQPPMDPTYDDLYRKFFRS